jgi:hypothetical protein
MLGELGMCNSLAKQKQQIKWQPIITLFLVGGGGSRA